MNAIDLFAGAGGWDLAANSLGFDPLGIELDDAACATREAAGFSTLQADVAALDPTDHGPCDLLIASPPCPSFSIAGKGEGIADWPLVYEAALAAARDRPVPPLPWRDERSALVVEPLRWAIALEPRFLSWEQVPPVLPFWEHCAEILRRKGWNVWTGIMEAERYGVPQTRERAILIADRERPVHPPRPTHQRYVKGEPQRHEETLEGEVLPWVSMAEALGWGMNERPSVTVASGGKRYGAKPLGGGSGSEATIAAERDRGAWVLAKTEDRPERKAKGAGNSPRSSVEPAATIDSRADLSKWVYDRRARNSDGSPVPPVPPVVEGTSPAPARVRAAGSPPRGQCRDSGPAAERDPRPSSAPTYTIRANGSESHPSGVRFWGGDGPQPHECPATTVAGDPRLSSGTHHNHGEQNGHSIRVILEEAAILQSFPPDFPFQGTKSQRFLQVGNAVPPLLAKAILSSLLEVQHSSIDKGGEQ